MYENLYAEVMPASKGYVGGNLFGQEQLRWMSSAVDSSPQHALDCILQSASLLFISLDQTLCWNQVYIECSEEGRKELELVFCGGML